MFGREYVDWCDKSSAASAVDAFLAAMPAYERKWALAVLRERYEVRVEYRDRPLLGGGLSTQNMYSSALARQNMCGQQHLGSSGSVISALARDLGL